MKVKIVLENSDTQQKTVSKEWEQEIKKSFFLSLKEEGLLTQTQYEECIRKTTKISY